MKPLAAPAGRCVCNHLDHDLVGDEAALPYGLGLIADGAAGRDRGAQHVAGRKLQDAVLISQALGLGSLPRSRRPRT